MLGPDPVIFSRVLRVSQQLGVVFGAGPPMTDPSLDVVDEECHALRESSISR